MEENLICTLPSLSVITPLSWLEDSWLAFLVSCMVAQLELKPCKVCDSMAAELGNTVRDKQYTVSSTFFT